LKQNSDRIQIIILTRFKYCSLIAYIPTEKKRGGGEGKRGGKEEEEKKKKEEEEKENI